MPVCSRSCGNFVFSLFERQRKDGVPVEGGIVSVSADGNTTSSTLSFTPTSADHGLILTCKASNQRIPFSEQQRTWMLKVLYPPKVNLTLGHGLDASDIKEGADVYFECHLVANPWVRRVWWLRNGERLLSNSTAGVIVSNQTLVLQGVSRFSSGRYCCEASNKEGTSKSPPFQLRVKFEPVCGDGSGRKVLGAAKDEPLRVECKVDAEPMAISFRWSFNSTPGISRELMDFTSEKDGTSILTYIPRVAADYGTLQCWGMNIIGAQEVPCTYHIVPAGKPDPPQSCAVANVSHHSVLINCKKGFDGGLRQRFVLMLSSGENPIANTSSVVPDFNVSSLEPSQDYSATVYSLNSKGSSKSAQPIVFRTQPAPGLKEQRRSTEPTTNSVKAGNGPWLYVLLAAASTLIVAAIIGGFIFAIRRFRVDSPVRNPRIRSPKMEESPLTPHVPPLYTDTTSDDNNPDLIPDAPTNENLLDLSTSSTMMGPIRCIPAPYTITAHPTGVTRGNGSGNRRRNCSTQMPTKPYQHHVTWAPILQSRNCATQTPPPSMTPPPVVQIQQPPHTPHKESSV